MVHAGVHVFVKGAPEPPEDVGESPWSCAVVSLTTSPSTQLVGSVVQVVAKFERLDADCICDELGCCAAQDGLCDTGCLGYEWCCADDECCIDVTIDSTGKVAETCTAPTKPTQPVDTPVTTPAALPTSETGGAKSRTNPPAKQPSAQSSLRRGAPSSNNTRGYDFLYAYLVINTTNAEWVAQGIHGGKAEFFDIRLRQVGGRAPEPQVGLRVIAGDDGLASGVLKVTGKGPVVVYVESTNGGYLTKTLQQQSAITITSTAVAKLKLLPDTAYRHCGDAITLKVQALDASNTPVANAKVAFSIAGECEPSVSNKVATTDATGCATFTFGAHEPGVATVIAAAVGANGAPVLSDSSNVFFFVERHDVDDREREYYQHEQ